MRNKINGEATNNNSDNKLIELPLKVNNGVFNHNSNLINKKVLPLYQLNVDNSNTTQNNIHIPLHRVDNGLIISWAINAPYLKRLSVASLLFLRNRLSIIIPNVNVARKRITIPI